MSKTKIGTKEWLDWNVGEGKRFKNLEDLLSELYGIRAMFGNDVGYAGGSINEEIKIIEDLIGGQQ